MRLAFSRDTMCVLLALMLCVGLSRLSYPMRPAWPGLPPAANKSAALVYGFGDGQFSYRNVGMMLQNAGDMGGRITHIDSYDYARVEDWLWLADALDGRANYVPGLAAYYFGAAKKPDELRHLIAYLAHVGADTAGERWRWLAHAVYLARFRIGDSDLALDLAYRLAAHESPDLPIWTKQMPAYVMSNAGQKKAARDLMLTIMATDKNLDSAEVNQTCWYIDKHLRETEDGLELDPVWSVFCADNPHK